MEQKGVGRPLLDIDWEKAASLANLGMKAKQIAMYFGVTYQTLYSRCETDLNISWSFFYQKNRMEGGEELLTILRDRAKMNSAELIYSCKSILGLNEKQYQKVQTESKITVTVNPFKQIRENFELNDTNNTEATQGT